MKYALLKCFLVLGLVNNAEFWCSV